MLEHIDYLSVPETVERLAKSGLDISMMGKVITIKDALGNILNEGEDLQPLHDYKGRPTNPLQNFVAEALGNYLFRLLPSLSVGGAHLQKTASDVCELIWKMRKFKLYLRYFDGTCYLELTGSSGSINMPQTSCFTGLPTLTEVEDTMQRLDDDLSYHAAFESYLKSYGLDFSSAEDGTISLHPFTIEVYEQKLYYRTRDYTNAIRAGLEALMHGELFHEEWEMRHAAGPSDVSQSMTVEIELA